MNVLLPLPTAPMTAMSSPCEGVVEKLRLVKANFPMDAFVSTKAESSSAAGEARGGEGALEGDFLEGEAGLPTLVHLKVALTRETWSQLCLLSALELCNAAEEEAAAAAAAYAIGSSRKD